MEVVRPKGLGQAAGVVAGDLLVSWRAGEHSGELSDPMQVRAVQVEQAALGPVEVTLQREDAEIVVLLPSRDWGLDVRPVLARPVLELYRRAAADGAGSSGPAVIRALTHAAAGLEARGDQHVAAWVLLRAGELTGGEPEELWDAARRVAEQAGDPGFHAWIEHRIGAGCVRRSEIEGARVAHSRALELRRQIDPDGLQVAESLIQLGNLDWLAGDPGAAERSWSQAETIRRHRAPGSLAHADALNNLGVAALYLGRLEHAERLHEECFEMRQELAPDSEDLASTLINLGGLALARGDLATSERHQRGALAILEPAAAPIDLANCVYNLGGLAFMRGDLDAAEHYLEWALRLREELAPESLMVAGSLNAIARLAVEQGDLGRAQKTNQRAMELRQRLAPDSLELAESLGLAAMMATSRGDHLAAQAYRRRELRIRQRLAPASRDTSRCRRELGELLAAKGDLDGAEREIRLAMAVGEPIEPEAWYTLARVQRARGESAEALRDLERAIAAVELRQRRLGGAVERSGTYREQYIGYFREAVGLLVEDGRAGQAVSMLERSRAQMVLAMLAERDLMFSAQIQPDLERRRRKVALEADRLVAEIGLTVSAGGAAGDLRGVGGLVSAEAHQDEPQETAALRRLRELRREQEEIRAEIRAASPVLASLVYPEPLGVDEIVRLLEPGTVMLSYCISESVSYLVVLEARHPDPVVIDLRTDEKTVRELVVRLRRALEERSAQVHESLDALSRLLLVPAMTQIERAERLVVVPDGPLHLVPFAALSDPTGLHRYLVVSRPLSVVASATLLGELRKRRASGSRGPVVAFADPQMEFPEATGHPAPELPGAREEVERLRELYGDRATVWLGSHANEARLKALSDRLSVLHLAVHGVIDQHAHLESALLMAPNGAENGLLQAWEIFDQLRLDVDLVTLSACDTALGTALKGEGLVGLSTAFLTAGARAVVASLWSVGDASTAMLMTEFYRHLRAGQAKDEAMRSAQLALIEKPETASPFYWAAFEVIGDAR